MQSYSAIFSICSTKKKHSVHQSTGTRADHEFLPLLISISICKSKNALWAFHVRCLPVCLHVRFVQLSN